MTALTALMRYLADLARRRREPGDDLVSRLLSEQDRDGLSEQDVIGSIRRNLPGAAKVLGFMGSALRFRFGCAAWASGHGSLPCRPDLPGSARRPVDAREALVLIRPRDSQLA
jgi:hypothetical protein